MKKKNFSKLAAAILSCALTMSVVSCDKNDDNSVPSAFKFNPAKAEVAAGSNANITISGGTEPYTVTSGDVKTATVSVVKNVITVTGVKAGNTNIQVKDKNKKVGILTVTVKAATALDFDKKSINVSLNKEETVTVKSGTSPFTATVKDASIATASVKDSKIIIKGVKAGTTTITVSDKNKLSGTISVTVK